MHGGGCRAPWQPPEAALPEACPYEARAATAPVGLQGRAGWERVASAAAHNTLGLGGHARPWSDIGEVNGIRWQLVYWLAGWWSPPQQPDTTTQ